MIFLSRLRLILMARDRQQRLWAFYESILDGAFAAAVVSISRGDWRLSGSIWRILEGIPVRKPVVPEALCFVLFVLLYLRLSPGDKQYMNRRYPGILNFCDRSEGRAEPALRRRCTRDILFLTFQALMLVLLADRILVPAHFFALLMVILLLNSAWLSFNYVRERLVKRVERRDGEIVIVCRYPGIHVAGNRWAMNNLFCLTLLILLRVYEHQLGEELYFWASSAVALGNSLADFALTHWVYIPEIRGLSDDDSRALSA